AYSYNYALLRATASGSHLQKLEPPPGENPRQFERLERMISHDADLRARLQKLLEQSPAATQKEIRAALNIQPPQRRPTTRPMSRPMSRSTTRPSRPNRPEWRDDHGPRRDGAKPPALTAEQQQMRERRVRQWFHDFKKREKPPE